MFRYIIGLSLLTLIACSPTSREKIFEIKPADSIQVPFAKKVPSTFTIHGETVVDDYAWLKDTTRKNPAVLEHLQLENAFTEEKMKHTSDLQKKMVGETLGRMKLDDFSFPKKIGDFLYYTKTEADKDYPTFVRRKDQAGATEEILLDVNILAKGHAFYNVGKMEVNPRQDILAFSVDTVGNEKFSIYFKDLKTGGIYGDTVKDSLPEFVWANDNMTVFYCTYTPAYRVDKVWAHGVGNKALNDKLKFEEKDEAYELVLKKSKSGRYLTIDADAVDTNEIEILDAETPDKDFSVFEPRKEGLKYRVYHSGDSFYILTNDNAVDYRVMKAPVASPQKASWVEFVPHTPGKRIGDRWYYEAVDEFSDHLAVFGRQNGLQTLDFYDLKTGGGWNLTFDEPLYSLRSEGNPDFESNKLRFRYSSFLTPSRLYEYDFSVRKLSILKENEVLGNFDPTQYEMKRIWAPSRDGQKIPISLVFKKGMKLDGSNLVYQYGYGSYGASMVPSFDYQLFSLLDRGVIYAMTHPRGGGEMGQNWYLNGRKETKKNTIYDFIDATEFLIRGGYTHAKGVAAHGISAGGILAGGVANERPDLYGAVIAEVPFVDVINTELDTMLRFTTYEWGEWGNPNVKKYYDIMKTYSPYENVKSQDYPNMLMVGGLYDTRVNYWEPAKFAAKVREYNTGASDIFLQILGAGHGGGSGRRTKVEEIAFRRALILDKLK